MLARFFKLDRVREEVSGFGGADFVDTALERGGMLDDEAEGGA